MVEEDQQESGKVMNESLKERLRRKRLVENLRTEVRCTETGETHTKVNVNSELILYILLTV